MSKKKVKRNLCIFLIGIVLVILLCMCSGCLTEVYAPKYGNGEFLFDFNVKPATVPTAPTFPTESTTPTTIPETTPPIIQETVIVEPPKTTQPPKPTEPETSYYDIPLSEDLQDHIFVLCEEHNIDPELVIAMIWRESRYKANAVGDNGNSLGLMQIQPRWHYERMDRLNCPDLLDPYQNITVGIDILSDLFNSEKPVEWVLMAYNGGRSYANRNWKAGKISSYAKNVLNYRDELTIKEE